MNYATTSTIFPSYPMLEKLWYLWSYTSQQAAWMLSIPAIKMVNWGWWWMMDPIDIYWPAKFATHEGESCASPHLNHHVVQQMAPFTGQSQTADLHVQSLTGDLAEVTIGNKHTSGSRTFKGTSYTHSWWFTGKNHDVLGFKQLSWSSWAA